MKNISDYKSYKGFYDLRDYNLPKKDFIKLWNIQEYLFYVENKKEYFKKFNKNMWEDAKELSANYQQCLFSHSLQQPIHATEGGNHEIKTTYFKMRDVRFRP